MRVGCLCQEACSATGYSAILFETHDVDPRILGAYLGRAVTATTDVRRAPPTGEDELLSWLRDATD
jgi:hypothetical protein